ncbi:MAG: isocitrate lyase/phosphoenolpyruvate mutase family protein [Acidimicrobiales bacterium]|jgi:2-methylisocitrate lyase-like PEP mutase family enzyme
MSASGAKAFLALHCPGSPLVMPNPWDVGSALALEALGFSALATTSSGLAATLGRLDGSVTRDEALAHAAQIVAAVGVPVSADLENGFGDEPEVVALTVEGAVAAGLAGCSIEDYGKGGIYEIELATQRVAAAVEAAAGRIVLTARAENYLHSRADLADTIARLQAYGRAGADVLYAPGIVEPEEIRVLVGELDRPVNVLLLPDGPGVSDLASYQVSRVSIGGSFAFAAFGTLARAALELQGTGPYTFWDLAAEGRALARRAFQQVSKPSHDLAE